MKNISFTITIVTTLLAGAFHANGQSADKKVDAAQVKVQDAKQNLKDARYELNVEYPAFKRDAQAKIAVNEKRISKLRRKADKPGRTLADNKRKERIDELEAKNSELRSRLYDYEKERSGWEDFKAKFNYDMENLRLAFISFSRDIKK